MTDTENMIAVIESDSSRFDEHIGDLWAILEPGARYPGDDRPNAEVFHSAENRSWQ